MNKRNFIYFILTQCVYLDVMPNAKKNETLK